MPAILYGIPLLVDPQDASRAIFQGRAFPMLGHAQLWVQASMPVIPTVLRVVAVLLSVVVPVVARRFGARAGVSTATILAAVFAARLVVEPVVFAYYLSPVLLFLAIEESARRASPRWTLLLGAVMLALFPVHPNVWAWWTVELCLGIALVVAVYQPSLLARRVPALS